MNRFPDEFADLLNRTGQKILRDGCLENEKPFSKRPTPFVILNRILNEQKATKCRKLLDKSLYDRVRPINVPIPPETITEMTTNYGELLPKTMKIKTAAFSSRSSLAYRAAREVGLLKMMTSESFSLFAEAVTGLKLYRDNSVQLILYEHGDYAGPHNDHHPEFENAAAGYVDVHIGLSSPQVESQFLVCEKNGYLSDAYSVTASGSVSVYKLPFWHYTTPMLAKPNKESEARRWLILGSFDIDENGAT